MRKTVFLVIMFCALSVLGCQKNRTFFSDSKECELYDVKFTFELLNPDGVQNAKFKITIRNSSDEMIWVNIENYPRHAKFIWAGKIDKGKTYVLEESPSCPNKEFVIELRDGRGNFISKSVFSLSKR